jgi:D-alanyl-D-alanine carboxypeptidase
MRVMWTYLAMLALAPAPAAAGATPTPRSEVRAIVRAAHVPGGVLLIRSHGHTHLVAAGYANLATHARMRTDDRFQVASVTKPFVATLVL